MPKLKKDIKRSETITMQCEKCFAHYEENAFMALSLSIMAKPHICPICKKNP